MAQYTKFSKKNQFNFLKYFILHLYNVYIFKQNIIFIDSGVHLKVFSNLFLCGKWMTLTYTIIICERFVWFWNCFWRPSFFWNWTMGLHNYTRWKKANFHWTDSTLSMGILRLLGGRDCWHGTNMTSLCSSNSCHRLPFPEEPLLELFYPCNEKETQCFVVRLW